MKKRILSLALAMVLLMGIAPITANAAVDDTYKKWSQSDSRWGWMSIGGGDTMSLSGCYITAVAKLLVHAGQQLPSNGFTPQTCLEGMKAHDMLTEDGLVKYGNFNYTFLPIYGSELYKENSNAHEKDPWDKGRAINEVGGMIRDGYYVIVCVMNKSTGYTHYMAVDRVSDDIYVMDNGAVLPLYGTWKYSGGVIDQVKFKYNGPYPYPAADYIDQLKFATIQSGLYSLAPACAPDKRLAVADGSLATQANVQLGVANTTDTAQQWEISSLEGGYYKLICKKSGLALDVAGAGTTQGTNVQQYWWTENKAQYWGFIDVGDGYYQIVTYLNGGLRLDVNGGESAEGTNVQLWTKNDGTPQKWKLIPVTATPSCDNGHTWGEWKTVKEAAYGVDGKREHTCSVCGKTESETIPSLTEPPIGTEIRRKTQYRYHRYEDNSGEYAVCAYWGNTTLGTTMHIAYSDWLDAPLPEVKQGYVDYLEHPNQGDNCTNAGCLSTDPFEVHRHVDANGKVWYYEETRVCHELAGGGAYYSYPSLDCVRGHDYAPSKNLSTTAKSVYICSRCGNLYTGQHGPAGTAQSGTLMTNAGKQLSWAITANGQFSLTSGLSQGETVLVACYNANGRFQSAKLVRTASAIAKIDPTTPCVKLFWLNSSFTPLSLNHIIWTP